MGRRYPFPIRLGSLGEHRELPLAAPGRSSVRRPIINLVHFVCYGTLLVEEKFNVFIDSYSDTDEPTMLRIRSNPQIKHHNMKF